jgi:hypothetical protein
MSLLVTSIEILLGCDETPIVSAGSLLEISGGTPLGYDAKGAAAYSGSPYGFTGPSWSPSETWTGAFAWQRNLLGCISHDEALG